MHYFEDPFEEVHSKGITLYTPSQFDHLSLEVTHGLCKYTIQGQFQRQRSLTKLVELQLFLFHGLHTYIQESPNYNNKDK